jgi:hypothetical protein
MGRWLIRTPRRISGGTRSCRAGFGGAVAAVRGGHGWRRPQPTPGCRHLLHAGWHPSWCTRRVCPWPQMRMASTRCRVVVGGGAPLLPGSRCLRTWWGSASTVSPPTTFAQTAGCRRAASTASLWGTKLESALSRSGSVATLEGNVVALLGALRAKEEALGAALPGLAVLSRRTRCLRARHLLADLPPCR